MIGELLNQRCIYWPPAELDQFGFQTEGESKYLPCRWQPGQKLIRSKDGAEKMSSATVYLLEEVDLSGRLGLGESEEPLHGFEPLAKSALVGLDGMVYGWKVWV